VHTVPEPAALLLACPPLLAEERVVGEHRLPALAARGPLDLERAWEARCRHLGVCHLDPPRGEWRSYAPGAPRFKAQCSRL
jgi:hypothetical protein